MDAEERQLAMSDTFLEMTARGINGERMGYWCFTHRDAVQTFKEYVTWLEANMPTLGNRPTVWWSARLAFQEVDFSGGGSIRFVSHPSQADGLKSWKSWY